MAKIHVSIRTESEQADRVRAFGEKEGLTASAAWCKLAEEGLRAFLSPASGTADKEPEEAKENPLEAVTEAQRATIELLRAQLETKDAQIAELLKLNSQAQTLNALAMPDSRPWWKKLFNKREE